MRAPCKNCPDRQVTKTVNCHSTCEKYLEYARERETIRERRLVDSLMFNHPSDRKIKAKIRRDKHDLH